MIDDFIKFLRRVIIYLLVLLTICMSIVLYKYVYGITCKEKYDVKDVNRDGKVSSIDYSIIKAYLMNKEVSNE